MKYLFFLFLTFVTGALQAQDYSDLVWSDEFNNDGAPAPANWGYDLGNNNGWGNNELQTYTNASNNVRVENGMLVIEARKSGSNWTSGRIQSQGKQSFTYGKVVYRAKLPQGSGTWPALWMLGASISNGISWPACGEIDVMEHVGKAAGVIHGSLHTPSSFGNTVNTGTKTISTYNSEFHDYAVLWTPDKIQFQIDDVPFYTYQPATKNDQTWPFKAPFFFIMNIAIGGNFGSDPQYETGGFKNGVDPALTLVRMEVDYIRVYQEFKALSLAGPTLVAPNQAGIVYEANRLQDATYEWTLPEGAQITAGAGTAAITVNWGNTEGDVSVKVTHNGTAYEKSLAVTQVVKPETDSFSLAEAGISWATNNPQNVYTVSEEGDVMRIDYTVVQPAATPSLTGALHRAVDLTDHPVLRVRTRSFNKSRTLNMRIDLVDNAGNATNKSPVFNLTPLVTDGEYFDYAFDFLNTNHWLSANGTVDKRRITTVNLYIDFGAFGAAGSDSLWIADLMIEKNMPTGGAPVRPSQLTGKITNGVLTLSWTDNSATEEGFELYASATATGVFTLLTSTAANTSAVAPSPAGADPMQLFYKVRAFNASGASAFSNVHAPADVITGVEDDYSAAFRLYPNPTLGTVAIELPAYPATLRLYNAQQKTMLKTTVTGPATLPLAAYPAGIYYIVLQGRNATVTRKLIIQ